MKKLNPLIITITDGWAFRYVFSTGAFEFLTSKYKVKIFASSFYFYKLCDYKKGEFELYNIEIKNSKITDKVISLKNYIYRNFHGFNISKFYISKLNAFQQIVFFLIKPLISSYGDRIILFLDSLQGFMLRKHIGKFEKEILYSDKILFLSPYSKIEVKFLNTLTNPRIKKYFVLPSWDNIYKYHLNDNYFKYIVWGPDQRDFLSKIGISQNKIVCLGSISQFVFNKLRNSDSIKRSLSSNGRMRIMYSTVTSKIFPEEDQLVSQLCELINGEYFGPNVDLLIRLHPADSSSEYKYLESERVFISGNFMGNNINYWDVANDFFELQVMDILSSNLIISVASTMTLDSIILGRATINYRPAFCVNEKDYYNFEHYSSITNSNGIKIANNFTELVNLISFYLKGEFVVDHNMNKSILGATIQHDDSEIENYFKILFHED
jgi:hypothetical protein